MDFAARTIPNPDVGGVQVEPFIAAIQGESILGLTTSPIYYRPPSGSPYIEPKYMIRMTWSILTSAERQQLELAATAIASHFGIIRLTGLGITRKDPPQLGGATEVDSAYVILAPKTNLSLEFSQDWRNVGGTIFGPVLYSAQITLLAGDVRYLYD